LTSVPKKGTNNNNNKKNIKIGIKLLLITFVLSVDIKIITRNEAQAYIRCF
tara:strand:+ start:570 stop:722 length:153 start_codon:yes stop_codon:yes gene_type:complete